MMTTVFVELQKDVPEVIRRHAILIESFGLALSWCATIVILVRHYRSRASRSPPMGVVHGTSD